MTLQKSSNSTKRNSVSSEHFRGGCGCKTLLYEQDIILSVAPGTDAAVVSSCGDPGQRGAVLPAGNRDTIERVREVFGGAGFRDLTVPSRSERSCGYAGEGTSSTRATGSNAPHAGKTLTERVRGNTARFGARSLLNRSPKPTCRVARVRCACLRGLALPPMARIRYSGRTLV